MKDYLYIEVNVFSCIILIFCALKVLGIKSADRRAFATMCYVQGSVFIFDALDALSHIIPNTPVFILYFVNMMFFICSTTAVYLWLRFERVMITRHPFNRKTGTLLAIPPVLTVIFAVTTPVTGWFFTINEQHRYARGSLYSVHVVFLFGFIAATMIYAIYYAYRLKDPTQKRNAFILSGFGCASFIAGVLDSLFPELTFVCAIVTIALVAIVFNFWESFVLTDRDMLKAATECAYPITVYVNLSKDEFRVLSNNMSSDAPEGTVGKYSSLLKSIYERIPIDEREAFKAIYNIDYMMTAYFDGRTEVTTRYRSLGNDDLLHWNEIMSVFIASRENDDILQVILVKNIDIEMAKEIQLRDARRSAEAANSAKTAFLFNMSHDIRTPMNAIIGFTSMAERHLNEPDKVSDCLGKVHLSSNHLLRLINDVLDMARIESGNIRIEEGPSDISKCGNEIYAIVQNSASDNGIEFRVEYGEIRDHSIYADALRVNQVLLNIVSNAIKYTNEGGHVLFRIEQLPDRHHGYGSYRFTISDNGIGMSPDFVDHIFDLFSRERTTTASGVEGTGLGMAITKQLVDAMGGHINVVSEPNVGTTVTIDIDFRLRPNTAISEPAPMKYDPAVLVGKRVLLVEDNELNREIACEILTSMSMIVDSAENGKIAVEKVRTANPVYNAVLMDIQMPIMDGYEATAAIRALSDHKRSDVPIIAMTANAFDEDRQRSYAAGMNDHLAKPVKTEFLLQTLSQYV